MAYKVLLYYKLHPIADPATFVAEHTTFCTEHDLKGRIIVASEGINGTCAGLPEAIDAYKEYVHSLPGFEDVWFKEQVIDHQPFPRLSVRVRPETVTFGVDGLDEVPGGEYLTPTQVNSLVAEHDDVVFFDMRSAIEGEVGRFKDAVVPDIRYFRQFPEKLKEYDHLKDKKVIMYCTGGIRCEKASKLLVKEGFKHVYQIEGGVYNYCQQFPDELFEGTCYVFDDRMNIVINKDKALAPIPEKIISSCAFCGEKSVRVVNDERKTGRVLIVCCPDCDAEHDVSRVRYAKRSPPVHLGEEVGTGQHYYPKAKVAQVKVKTDSVLPGDELTVRGPLTGVIKITIEDIKVHPDEPVEDGWQVITFPCAVRIRGADVLYKATSANE